VQEKETFAARIQQPRRSNQTNTIEAFGGTRPHKGGNVDKV
jgi:hypothetical protein